MILNSTTNHRLLRKNDESPWHTSSSPGLVRIVGALALAIVLAVGGSAAIAGFLTDWGRHGNPDSRQPSATQPSQTTATSPAAAPSSSSPTSQRHERTATALQAIATAENQVRHGKVFDLEDQTETGRRGWSAKVATADGRQFNLRISHDGSSVVSIIEDMTPTTMSTMCGQPRLALERHQHRSRAATGKGNLTSPEIDINNSETVVWQIEFGGDDGTTVQVDATSGEVLDLGPDTD
jgi:hypothetical protein